MSEKKRDSSLRYPETYQLIKEEDIQEINGTARLFKHCKTGAKIIYLSNHDDNKVFSIGFKTPSDDSTGVAHIMEHSVLCGSSKYPVKEPFVELAKGSLNTFLNAMTYPDKTVYPIASTNEKDFMNLMDVYLDAVFHPAIYDNPEIFMQEGWHYHLENTEDELTLNGVVYNEMKGVYSSPEEILANLLFQALYPDTIYRGESGGHPDYIPNLTYEGFLKFHQTYYHPSNSYIYFYGDGDIYKHLDYLDREYLSDFELQQVESDIPIQPAFDKIQSLSAGYPVSAGESTEGKEYLTLGWVVPTTFEKSNLSHYETMLALDILGHILLENNSAPLKKALLEMNICKEVDYAFSTSLQQPYFAITLKNAQFESEEAFKKTIFGVLAQLAKEGLNSRDVEAGVNSAEFTLREGESGTYPKGLMIGLEIFDTWLYDDGNQESWKNRFTAFDHLKYNQAITHVRDLANNGGLEALLEEAFLNNKHCALVRISPDEKMAEKQEKLLAEKLSVYKDSLDAEIIDQLVIETQTLLQHQGEEDSQEALATIPKLSLDEINPKTRAYVMQKEALDGYTLLWHPGETNGIIYVKLIFDIHPIPQELLRDLALFTKLLGELSTEDYSLEELIQEMEIYTGGITTTISTIDHTVNTGAYEALMTIKGKAVFEQLSKLMALMSSILQKTIFEDERTIHDLIREIRMEKEQRFLTSGHAVGIQRLQSYYSQSAALYDEIGGMSFYHYLVQLDDYFENSIEGLKERLSAVASKLFRQENMTLSLTCEPERKAEALEIVTAFLNQLPERVSENFDYHFGLSVKNEGYQTAAKIQYVCKGYNYKMLGYDYHGSLLVLKSYLYTGYLWTKIRVQGGAYGGMCGVNRAGELYFASYRDPNLRRSIEVYDQVAEYISQLDISPRELEKVIIGTISSKDTPLSPALLADAEDTMYFNGSTPERIQQERDEILHTTSEDLKNLSELVSSCMHQNVLCVIGGEEVIQTESNLFNEVKNIFDTTDNA